MPARAFNGRRNLVGVPAGHVNSNDARHRPFIEAVLRMLCAPRALVVNTSSVSDLKNSCPGGFAYLESRLATADARIRWINCGGLWCYLDPHRGITIRSAEHLYGSLERLLAETAAETDEEVFLLRPGSPRVGDELSRLWTEREREHLTIYDTCSPVELAVELVERTLTPLRKHEQHHYLSGPEFLGLDAFAMRGMDGFLVLRSLDDAYAPDSRQGSVTARVLKRICHSGFWSTAYLCHVGEEDYVVPCQLSEVPTKWWLLNRAVRPWTIVLTK